MRLRIWVALALGLLVAGAVLANEVLQATECDVPAGRVVEGNLYVVCQELTIAGTVEGALVGIAMNVTLTGTVDDDIYLMARTLRLDGTVGEDVLVAAGSVVVGGSVEWVEGDLIAIAADVQVEEGARLPGSFTTVAYQTALAGEVAGDVLYLGEALNISGQVGGDVEARTGAVEPNSGAPVVSVLLQLFLNLAQAEPGLRLADDAVIGGDLAYISLSEGALRGKVTGETRFTQVVNPPTFEEFVAEDSRIDALRAYFAQVVQDVLVLTLVGAVLIWLWPRGLLRPVEALTDRVVVNTAVGGLALVLSVPVFVLALVLSLTLVALLIIFVRIEGVTLVVASALGLTTVGGGGLFYFVAAYVARAVTASALGTLLIMRITQADLSLRQRVLSVAVGAVFTALLGSLYPFGWVFNLISAAIGVGAIWRALRRAVQRPVPPPMAIVEVRASGAAATPPHLLPPPLPGSSNAPRGMENLPQGFRWWDDE